MAGGIRENQQTMQKSLVTELSAAKARKLDKVRTSIILLESSWIVINPI